MLEVHQSTSAGDQLMELARESRRLAARLVRRAVRRERMRRYARNAALWTRLAAQARVAAPTRMMRRAAAGIPVVVDASGSPVATLEAEPRLRLAATADVQVEVEAAGRLRPCFADVARRADVLLIAGDLTEHGLVEEAEVLAGELSGLDLPIICVLGNHDHYAGAGESIRDVLARADIRVLEGAAAVIPISSGKRLGVAGLTGFGGGFDRDQPADAPAWKQAKHSAGQLEEALRELDSDVRVALTHYSPIIDTARGEASTNEIGCYLLGDAIDSGGATLAIHGHAHHGNPYGTTKQGIPVHNVAVPVIAAAYKVIVV